MIITLDFETAFGKHPDTGENITLTSMTNEEYVRHPLFKVLGVGIKFNDRPTAWYTDWQVEEALAAIPWNEVVCLAHHAHFDGAILNWIYGHRPKFWLDTLSMANAVFPWMSSALGRLAKHYGMEEKGAALNTTRNKWVLTPQEDKELGDYCIHDVDLTWGIYQHLKEGFPLDELKLIDMTVRMYTEPKIEVDKAVVLEDYKNELRQKRQFMKTSGVTRKELMSNPKFADRLLALGVEPPMKTSPRTGKQTFAFAKSDDAFNQLLDHEDPKVQALVEARFSVKSTIKETRSKRFYKIGTRGAFPVYLRYYGAHSSRWSGGDKANPQNMTRYNPQDPTSGALRRSWVAPKGQVFVVCDLSQIEARLLAYWAQQEDLVGVFRDGGDPYNSMASSIYGREVDRKNNPDDKIPGMVGKAVTLGCIAEGEMVLTDQGLVPIENVSIDMRVWDGVEWVNHTGVIYQGDKEVMSYGGLTATPDHKVFLEDGSTCEFQEAPTSYHRLARTEHGGCPLRYVGDNLNRSTKIQDTEEATVCVPRLRCSGVEGSVELAARQEQEVSAVYGEREQSVSFLSGTGAQIRRDRSEMQRADVRGVQTLRCQRDQVPIQDEEAVHTIRRGPSAPQGLQGGGDRSHKQRRTLQAGEPTLGVSSREQVQPQKHKVRYIQRNNAAPDTHVPRPAHGRSNYEVLPPDSGEPDKEPRTDRGADIAPISQLDELQTKRTYDITNAGPRNRFTVSGYLVHNCGYSMSWKAFQSLLRTGFLGMPSLMFDLSYADQLGVDVREVLKKPEHRGKNAKTVYEEAVKLRPAYLDMRDHLIHCAITKVIIDRFRKASPKIVKLWSDAGDALKRMMYEDSFFIGAPDVMYVDGGTEIFMPNGMRIQYHKLEKTKDGFKYLSNEKRKEWAYIYGGKVCVSCGTLVLTSDGWMPIEEVTHDVKVWDGEEWVSHDGAIFNGIKKTIEAHGVRMTPDHLVLTEKGWVDASQSEGYNRAKSRLPDGFEVQGIGWKEIPMASKVRLREDHNNGCLGTKETEKTRDKSFLRMQKERVNSRKEFDTRDVEAPGLRSMEIYARQVHERVAQSLQKLWRAGDICMREMGKFFRELLGGYGRSVQAGAVSGEERQRGWIQERELLLGNENSASQKPKNKQAGWRKNSIPAVGRIGGKRYHHLIQDSERLAGRTSNGSAELQELVYDIRNCGKRNRFVVRDKNGSPLIVHNCENVTQGVARVVISEQMLQIAKELRIVSTTHDEIICLAPASQGDYALAFMKEVMTTSPTWAPTLPLDAEGGVNECYGLCEK